MALSRTPQAILVACGLAIAVTVAGAQAPGARSGQAAASAESETSTWYFYKVKWGYQDEFLDLFQRNHYPVLKALKDAGQYSAIRTYTPRYHGDGRADWTFAVELVRREGVPGMPTEAEVVQKLYPDREKFRREEQRRFEILDAHWDVPLNVVDLDSRRPSR